MRSASIDQARLGLLAKVASALMAAVALALLAPAGAGASVIVWGSDLSAPANADQATQQAAVYSALALPGSASSAPASGQVLSVKVKGTARRNPAQGAPAPLTVIHFQDLRPQADGSYAVATTSQGFSLPDHGDPGQVSTFSPTNLCVHAGDRLGLTTSGGFDATFYPSGVHFQIFAAVGGSTTGVFVGPEQNGQRITLTPRSGLEPLMQVSEGTGSSATALCPGGHQVRPRHHRHKKHHRRHKKRRRHPKHP